MLNKELLLIGEGAKDTVTFILYKPDNALEGVEYIAYIDYGSDTYRLDIEDFVTVPYIKGMNSFTLRSLYDVRSLKPDSLVYSQTGPKEFRVVGLEPNMIVVITIH